MPGAALGSILDDVGLRSRRSDAEAESRKDVIPEDVLATLRAGGSVDRPLGELRHPAPLLLASTWQARGSETQSRPGLSGHQQHLDFFGNIASESSWAKAGESQSD